MAWNLGDIFAKLTLDTSDFNANIKSAASAIDTFGKDMGNNLNTVANTLTNTGKLLSTAITAPVVAFGTYSIKAAADFELAMANVQAVAQVTDKELAQLTELARELGRATVFSAEEAAQGLYYMALAGWDTNQMLVALEPVLKLAAAGQIELATASDIVTDAITAFGYSAEDTQLFVDVLAQTMANSNTDVTQLGEAFKYVGTTAGQLNYSLEDVAVALGLMANQGIKAGQAGRSLNQLLQSLKNPTDAAAAAMEEYGISIFNADGSSRDLGDVLIQLRSAFEGLTDEEAAYLASTLTTTNGQRALNAIINSSTEDFETLTGVVNDSEGALDQMYETITDTTNGAWYEFKSALESVAITMGNILLPIFNNVLKGLTSFLNWFDNLDPKIQTFILALAAVAASIGPILLAMGAIIKAVNTIKAFKLLVGTSKIAGAISSLIPTIWSAAAAVAAFLGPVGLAVAAVAALAAGLVIAYNKSESFRKAVNKAFDSVKKTISGWWDNISKALSNFGDWLTNIPNAVGEWASSVGKFFGDVAKNAVDSVKEWTSNTADSIVNWASNAAASVGNFAADVGTFVTEEIPQKLASFGRYLNEDFLEDVGTAVGAAAGTFATFAVNVGRSLAETGRRISEWGSETWSSFTAWAEKTVNDVGEWFASLPSRISDGINDAIDRVSEWGQNVWNTFEEWITKTIDDITTWFSEVPDRISNAIKEAVNRVAEWGQNVWNSFREWISKTLSDISTWFSEIPGRVWNAIKAGINRVAEWGQGIWETFRDWARKTIDDVTKWFSEIPNNMLEIGKNIVRGLWNGISSLGGWLGDQVKNFCNGVVNGFTKFFRISSPSKLMEDEVGYWTGRGLGTGIMNSLPEVLEDVSEFADEVMDGLQDDFDNNPNINLLDNIQGSLDYQPSFIDSLTEVLNTMTDSLESIADRFSNFMTGTPEYGLSYQDSYTGNSQRAASENNSMNIVFENVNIRNDDDIEKITRSLFNRQQRSRRSNGVR